jgi:hypothetical protein
MPYDHHHSLESGAILTFWQRQDACAWAIAALELPSGIATAKSMPCSREAMPVGRFDPERQRLLQQ